MTQNNEQRSKVPAGIRQKGRGCQVISESGHVIDAFSGPGCRARAIAAAGGKNTRI